MVLHVVFLRWCYWFTKTINLEHFIDKNCLDLTVTDCIPFKECTDGLMFQLCTQSMLCKYKILAGEYLDYFSLEMHFNKTKCVRNALAWIVKAK